MTPTKPRELKLLLVEDNPGDARLILEALRESTLRENKLHLAVQHVSDGVEAMAALRGGAPHPDLVVLDLNLPRKDGLEVLAELKEDRNLRRIPVMVLTSSAADSDVLESYRLQANCFITKPMDLDNFMFVVRAIEKFWMETATLPPH